MKKKHIVILILAVVVCMTGASICIAITPQSTYRPTATWNIATSGTYAFDGHTENETLYTNYRFTGCDSYTITIQNDDDHDQTVKIRRASDGNQLAKFTVPEGEEFVYTFNSSNVWYLEFYINSIFPKGCDITGTIESAD